MPRNGPEMMGNGHKMKKATVKGPKTKQFQAVELILELIGDAKYVPDTTSNCQEMKRGTKQNDAKWPSS